MDFFKRVKNVFLKQQVEAGISVTASLAPTEIDEKGTVRRWLEHNQIKYAAEDLKLQERNSDIDITVHDLSFQVTKLPSNEFFRSLRTNGSASLDHVKGEDFVGFIRQAVEKKLDKNYSPMRKKEIRLLIDGYPLEFPASILSRGDRRQLRAIAARSGFREIWFVGVGPDYIFNLDNN